MYVLITIQNKQNFVLLVIDWLSHWFLIFLLCVRTKKSTKQMTWLKNSLDMKYVRLSWWWIGYLTEFEFRFWNSSLSKWDKHLKIFPKLKSWKVYICSKCLQNRMFTFLLCTYLFGSQNRNQITDPALIVCPYTEFSDLIFS